MAARLLAQADIEFEPMRALLEPATRLAITLGHTAYDCCYLALAEALDCEFVTADEVLCRTLRSSALPLKIRELSGCIRVDERAGAFGDKSDYRVILGY